MPRSLLACAAVLAAALAGGLGTMPVAEARIVSVEIESSEAFAGGRDFGAGPYLRISGKAHGELDPADPRNAVILDLDRAPRNARGMVEYATEFHLLRPADPARASGRMVHEVTNRGRKLLFSYFYDAAGLPEAALNEMRDARAVGNALPLAQGHVLLWNGWDPAAPRGPGNLLLAAPVLEGVTGTVRDEFVFGTRIVPADRLDAPLSFAAAEPDAARAALTVRRTRAEPSREVPRDAWSLCRAALDPPLAGRDALRGGQHLRVALHRAAIRTSSAWATRRRATSPPFCATSARTRPAGQARWRACAWRPCSPSAFRSRAGIFATTSTSA